MLARPMAGADLIERTIERLCTPPPRRAGTDAERRAANWLAERLRVGGRVELETTYVHPRWPASHLLHCLLALGGSLAAPVSPAAGFALVLLAATSLYLDLSGRAYLLRRLFFRRVSQNVLAPPLDDGDVPRVIITAGYDTELTGAAYSGWGLRAFERLQRALPVGTSPMALVFWAIALLLPPLGARLAGIEADWVSYLQLPQTLLLIVACFALGEIALSPPSPGANGNASGVASAMRARAKLEGDPPEHLRVHVLLAGAGEAGGEGLRWFLRTRREDLPPARTWLIALERTGRGIPSYVAREAPVLTQPADPTLLALCEALAEGSSARSGLDLGPAGAASIAAAQGYPAIAITAREHGGFVPADHRTPADTPERLDPEAIEGAAAFAADLVALLDRELGRRPTD